uniref:SdrD B-like domain-containing protein n=1 Tax=uncultured Varibaculum sp. TaxID=413896 RepID=UPI002583FCBD
MKTKRLGAFLGTLLAVSLVAAFNPWSEVAQALEGNDFDVNTAWTTDEVDNITTDFTSKFSGYNQAYSKAAATIGDNIGVVATFEKQAQRDKGATYLTHQGTNQAAYGATKDLFVGEPDPATVPALGIAAQGSTGSGGSLGSWEKINLNGASEVGTVTFKFSKKVTNPILDISGLGGYVYSTNNLGFTRASFNATDMELLTEGVKFVQASKGENLKVTDKTLEVAERNTYNRSDELPPYNRLDCGKSNYLYPYYYSPEIVQAGTGSVRLEGTFDTVKIKLSHHAVPFSAFKGGGDAIYVNNANRPGYGPSYGDGINGLNVLYNEKIQIGPQVTTKQGENIDFFRLSFRVPKSSQISGRVWNDTDKDGIQAAGENQVSGVTVKLLDEQGNPATDASGNPVADAVTDEQGAYSFPNLAAGKYKVQFVPPAGQKLTKQGKGAAEVNSDANPDTRTTEIITLGINEQQQNIDAGLVPVEKFKVTHKFESATPGMDLPKAVLDLVPANQPDKADGSKVTPTAPAKTEVKVAGGTWKFVPGYTEKDATIEGADHEFVGKWTFVADP